MMIGLSACVGAIFTGGAAAILGGIGLAAMAAIGYAVIKKEAEIEQPYQPPVRYEHPPKEDGYHFQQIVAEGRGAGRER